MSPAPDHARHHRLEVTADFADFSKIPVDVGVPVHNALDDVSACLKSVAATRTPETRIIVVDDGSSVETRDWLRRFAADRDYVTLIRHEEAQGYTRAANAVFKAAEADQVVLLNSDTIVPTGWLERLLATAASSPDIGMVGPLSNAASWQSVPRIYATPERRDLAVNSLPSGWEIEDLDTAVALFPSVVVPRVPLLNGFCTLIKRSLIEEIGYYDEVSFPRGYGEENDYAFRATDAGAALVVATNVYIFHAKSRSFTHAGRQELSAAGSKAFRGKWPKRRIDEAIKTMRDHPILVEKRAIMEAVYEDVFAGPHIDSPGIHVGVPEDPDAVIAPLLKRLERVGVPLVSGQPSASQVSAVSDSGRVKAELHLNHDGQSRVAAGRAQNGEIPPNALDLGENPEQQARRIVTLLKLLSIPGLSPGRESEEDHQGTKPATGEHSVQAFLQAFPVETPSTQAKPVVARRPADPFLDTFDADAATIAASRKITDRFREEPFTDLSSVTWFVPAFENVLRGGLRTIFSIAADLQEQLGTDNRFVLCSNQPVDVAATERHVREHIPTLNADYMAFRYGDDPHGLPRSGAAVSTLWTTAYVLLRYNQCGAKFYLVQDWEPTFYEAGARSALIEETYRFGFTMLANSPGVAERCRFVDPWVGAFRPGVDTQLFHPAPDRGDGPPYRIVFYGRPKNPRNGFELGVESLRRVKAALGESVDIISVGADYDEAEYGLEGVVRNLGVLTTLEEVAALYRASHVGLVFMYTAHPSYQPLEYMASGCVTVTNGNPYNSWLLQDGQNCVFAPNTVSGVADTLVGVLEDADLRRRVAEAGLSTVAGRRWIEALAEARAFLAKPRPADGSFLE